MKTKIRLWLYLALLTLTPTWLNSQQSFLYKENGVVFYPAHFDSSRMMPSMALVKNLTPAGDRPAVWRINPEFSKENGKNIITIHYEAHVDLYGNGEVVGNLKRNGTSFTTWNTDNYTYTGFQQKHLYQSHPWILGVRKDGTAFGILVDNTWKHSYSLSNPVKITCEGPAPRVIVFERENPQAVLEELAWLTGTMEMPPLWALGFQQCRYSYFPDTRVKEVASEFRKRNIPCDVIWMDIDYMNGFRVFTFDKLKFPDPKGLNDYLHSINFRSVYMIDPGIKVDTGYFVFDQGNAGNYWVKEKNGKDYRGNVWPGLCVFPDFTSPSVRKWWGSLYKDFMATGIDGVWNDMNEPAVFGVKSMTMPEDNLHAGGEDLPADEHLRYHNVYGMLMVKASRDGIMNIHPDRRPFVLSRSNFMGGQRYGATWTGDNASTWDYLRMSIPMSLNLSLSGQPFNGADIGGFSGNANEELLAHWMTLGVYYPFSRNHSANNTVDQEPWAFGKKVEDISRTAINRRYVLLPYIYTLFHEASVKGTPVMQPVYWSDVKDSSLRSEQEAFLLGKDLMIVPRWAHKPALPKGDWDMVNLENSDDGYQPYLFLRPGAILPAGSIIQSTVDYKTDSITLFVNPAADGSATGTLYDDAGEGFGYKNGDYSITHFQARKIKKGKLEISVQQTEGNRKGNRLYRIGLVTDNGVVYSAWTSSNSIQVKYKGDTKTFIDTNSLKMSNFQFTNKSLQNVIKGHNGQGENY